MGASAELELVILGSGGGLPTGARDTSGYLIRCGADATLVDCPGGIVHKLRGQGMELGDLGRVIVTHDHVDHLYGLPHLVHALAIEGLRPEIDVIAPAQALGRIDAVLRAFDLLRPGYPRVRGVEASLQPGALLHDDGAVRIRSTPARHARETLALRFEAGNASVTLSSDTLPAAEVVELARATDLLLHDCGGLHQPRNDFGASHASAREAGEVAAAAGACALLLVHLGSDDQAELRALCREAATAFDGPVDVGIDGACYRPGRQHAGSGLLR